LEVREDPPGHSAGAAGSRLEVPREQRALELRGAALELLRRYPDAGVVQARERSLEALVRDERRDVPELDPGPLQQGAVGARRTLVDALLEQTQERRLARAEAGGDRCARRPGVDGRAQVGGEGLRVAPEPAQLAQRLHGAGVSG